MQFDQIRQRHFVGNWLAWVALRHFLPVSLMRELSSVMVQSMSANRLQLADLFDEEVYLNHGVADAWVVTPKLIEGPLASYLQGRIRSFVWKSDTTVFFDTQTNWSELPIPPSIVEAAADIGAGDLLLPNVLLDRFPQTDQVSIGSLIAAMRVAKQSSTQGSEQQFLEQIESVLSNVEMPLFAVSIKHLGDLLADGDNWSKAAALYRKVLDLCSGDDNAAWEEIRSSIVTITVQSLATSLRILHGDKAAADLYDVSRERWENINSILFNANSSHESLSVHTTEKQWPRDDRTSILLAPQLISTHSLETPLFEWLNSQLADAHQHFWGVLRRQIGLGSTSQARVTKAFYARSLITELKAGVDTKQSPDMFLMAVRLAIESCHAKSASLIEWDEKIVGLYVDEASVEFVIQHAEAYEAVQSDRQFVAIELLSAWALHIPANKQSVATKILIYLADLAERYPASFYASKDVGVTCLKSLKQIAERRAEWRCTAPDRVAKAVIAHLTNNEWWTGASTAAETAIPYVGTFSELDLGRLAEAALVVLEKLSPSANFYVVVRPIQELLVSSKLRDFIRADSKLETRAITQILRFGLEQENDHALMMYHLRVFNVRLLEDKEIRKSLESAIAKIEERTKNINISSVLDNIQALLNASELCGVRGIQAAVDGLTRILTIEDGKRPNMVLPYAYGPLLMLANQHERIAASIEISDEEFKKLLRPLVGLLIRIWHSVKDNLTLFVPFSIPPSNKPSPVIVHNWAFVSIQFAEVLGEEKAVQDAIALAVRAQPTIADTVERASVIRTLVATDYSIDTEAIRNESRDAFYLSLGRRLSLISSSATNDFPELCEVLLDTCFRHGPHDLDMSVFTIAVQRKIVVDERYAFYKAYMERLETDSDQFLNFMPLLRLLGHRYDTAD